MSDRLRNKLVRIPQKLLGMPHPVQKGSAYVAVDGRNMQTYRGTLEATLAPFANPFAYYEEIVRSLVCMNGVTLVPACELMQCDAADRRVVTLRHDLDADPLTGLRAARFLARFGVCGSFYLLHTSGYYADMHEGVVVRNPELAEWIRAFIVTGCELGLHNDALWVYQQWRKNGVAALIAEIQYLRAHGAVVRGTVAHNSGPAYGAENYEIFVDRRLWSRKVVSAEGFALPLGWLEEGLLGLNYEGTFAIPKRSGLDAAAAAAFFKDRASADIRSESWMKRYLLDNPCCDWAVDYQFWLLGKDRWVAAGAYHGERLFEWDIGLARALELIRSLPTGSRTLLVIHPEYVQA